MVYKHKNNKKARDIAARKLRKAAEEAAANADAAHAPAAAQVGADADEEEAAAAAVAGCTRGELCAAERNEEEEEEERSSGRREGTSASHGATGDTCARTETESHSNCLLSCDTDTMDLCSATPPAIQCTAPPPPPAVVVNALRERDSAVTRPLPVVVAAALLPVTSHAGPHPTSGASHVAYCFAEDVDPSGALPPQTVWGVHSLANGSCLQVVHWRRSSGDDASTVAEAATPTSSAHTRAASTTEEVIMHVNAAGLCFMLAPASLLPAGGAAAAAASALASPLASATGTSTALVGAAAEAPADVYWLIPAALSEIFIALLEAQAWLSSARRLSHVPATQPASSACPLWRAQAHPARWAATADVAVAQVGEAGSPQTPAPSLAQPSNKKKKKRVRHPPPPPQPPTPETARTSTPAPLPYSIPYVAAVEQQLQSSSGGDKDDAAVSLLLIGNRVSPYPADELSSAATA